MGAITAKVREGDSARVRDALVGRCRMAQAIPSAVTSVVCLGSASEYGRQRTAYQEARRTRRERQAKGEGCSACAGLVRVVPTPPYAENCSVQPTASAPASGRQQCISLLPGTEVFVTHWGRSSVVFVWIYTPYVLGLGKHAMW